MAKRPRATADALLRELARISAGTSGNVGIAVAPLAAGGAELASDPEAFTGPSLVGPPPVGLRLAEHFAMASTFKLPLACVVLRMADEGKLATDDTMTLSLADVRPGMGELSAALLRSDGNSLAFSIYELLERMMNDSDNVATDVLLRRVGGPKAVSAYCASLGLDARRMNVARGCLELIRDHLGISPDETPGFAAAETYESDRRLLCEPTAPQPSGQDVVDFVAMLKGRMEALPLASLRDADAASYRDLADTATPEAMCTLLQLIWQRQAGLSDGSTKMLFGIMANCRTCPQRMPGGLPPFVRQQNDVLHKTGTLGGRANDVGFVRLPDGKGAIAIAIYINGPPAPGQNSTSEIYAERDGVIADLARACYDYFLFTDG